MLANQKGDPLDANSLLTARPPLQLLNKDFYHLSATTFEFKDTTPNGVAFKVTGKSSHEKATSAAVSRANLFPPALSEAPR